MNIFSSDFFIVWFSYLKPLFFYTLITVMASDRYKSHLIKYNSETVDNSAKIANVTRLQNFNAKAIGMALVLSAIMVATSNAFIPQMNKFDSEAHINKAVVMMQEQPEPTKPIVDKTRQNDMTKEERKAHFDNITNWKKD